MKIIVVANTAGGVGKTTTAHAISVAAVEYGKKALAIDADPGSALTFCCGIENPRITAKEFLAGEYSLDSAVAKTAERFALLPSSSRLASLDIDTVLSAEKLRSSFSEFDLVVIDTATGPQRLATFFLAMADLVLIPTSSEILGIRGALHTLDFARASGFLSSAHLLLTAVNGEISSEISEMFAANFAVLEPSIRFDLNVSISQLQGRSLLTLDNKSEVASDYREITYSLLEELSLI